MFREEIELVDLQAQIARLYLCIMFHVEWDDALDQRGKPISITKIITYCYIILVISYFSTEANECACKSGYLDGKCLSIFYHSFATFILESWDIQFSLFIACATFTNCESEIHCVYGFDYIIVITIK